MQAQHVTIRLPRLRLASRTEELDLVLEGSLLLSLPATMGCPSTGTDLLELVTARRLWIRRSGPCHFNVSVSAGGDALPASEPDNRLAQWVLGCEARALPPRA